MTQQQSNNLVIQGRLVWTTGSSIFAGKQKTDFNTNQPITNQQGEPVMEYGFGLAIPKVNPATGQNTEEFTKVWNTLHQEAFTLYPSGQLPPGFAMKFKDGDAIDHNGKNFADREGYAGHIVLTCTTQIPIKFFKFEGGNNILVNDGIKNGDYVNVQLGIKAHPAKGAGKPGLYVNPSAVQFIQAGKEIINTPSGDQLFGQAAPAYAGQVVADQAPVMPGQVAPVAPGVAPAPVQPAMAPAPVAPAAAPVAPAHYQVLPANMQPAPAPVAPVQPQMAPAPVAPAPVQPQMAPAPVQPAYAAPVQPAMPQMPQ